MTFGERTMTILQSLILNNLFIVIWIVAFSLFMVDYYNRFLKIIRNTDHVDLVERYCWLTYLRRRKQ
jgi:hypothetical protein